MQKIPNLRRSIFFIMIFYLPLFACMLLFLVVFHLTNANLFKSLSSLLLGSLFIALFTQMFSFIIEKYDSIQSGTRNFLYENFSDFFLRSSAGFLEMTLYVICFAANLSSLVAGYLLLKTVSIWQKDYNNKKEGLHTAILRIAVVLSLLFSLMSSYYLIKFING